MTRKANKRCCETCRHDLGGGYNNCRINLEAECGDGGFEAWEPKEDLNKLLCSIEITTKSFGISIKEIIQSLEAFKAAMQSAKRSFTQRHPRKIQIARARAMLKRANIHQLYV